MKQRKQSLSLFRRITAAFFAAVLMAACVSTPAQADLMQAFSSSAAVSSKAYPSEKSETPSPAAVSEKSETPSPAAASEKPAKTPEEELLQKLSPVPSETETPSPTPFYEPEVEEDPAVKYLEKPDPVTVDAQTHRPIPLWHSKEYLPYAAHSYMPSIFPYLAEGEEAKTSVIIFPGGAYESVSLGREGTEAAEYLCRELNMNAFVVNYRVFPSNYRAILSDALRAVRFIRFYSEQFHADRNRIVVLGFSAGGHLAMMTGEHFDYGKAGDDIDGESSRPDAVFLCYPVGSLLESFAHKRSRNSFLGKEDTEENRIRFSAEKGLRPDTPPVFLVHCKDDRSVSIENSIEIVNAMEQEGLDVSYRWYPKGGHGFGIAGVKWHGIDWPLLMKEWLAERGF